MSSDNNSNRSQLEARAKQEYWKEFQKGVVDLFREAPRCWNGPDAVHYRAEKEMIKRHVEPFYWGALVTVFLFATFRVSGSKWYERVRARLVSNKSSITNHSSGTSSQKQQTKEWMSHLDTKLEQRKEYHEEMLKLPSDIFVSVMCGLSSIALLSKPSELEKNVNEAPLLPGKSTIYETMCPGIEHAFERTFDQRILEGEIDFGVRSFAVMVHNCKTRTAFVNSRQDKTERPDIVPYPGLLGSGR